MEIKIVTSWQEALDSARATVRKAPLNREPSNDFKKDLVIAEHSPLRPVIYRLYDPSCSRRVALHLIRHINGSIPFVGTTRDDIIDNPDLNVVPFMFYFNYQTMINISLERLCRRAHKDTFYYVDKMIYLMERIDGDLVRAFVPKCVYRGFCPERKKSCGYAKSPRFAIDRSEYLDWADVDV